MERVATRARAMVLAAVAVTALMPLLPSSGASHGEGCMTSCGNISIPYPFGVEPGCYHDGGFNLTCNKSYSPPRLFLGDGTVQVLDISIPNATLRINSTRINFDTEIEEGPNGTVGINRTRISVPCNPGSAEGANGTWRAAGLGYHGGPYFLAVEKNNLVAIGCGIQVNLLRQNNTLVSSCANFCPKLGGGGSEDYEVGNDRCNGVGCCQSSIAGGLASYELQLHRTSYFRPDPMGIQPAVFIVDSELTSSSATMLLIMDDHFARRGENHAMPAVLGWRISSSACPIDGYSSPSCRSNHSWCANASSSYGYNSQGHTCECPVGYQGNPYISDGCYDINECNSPGIYPCYGDCENTQGGYHCNCPPGFTGNASIQNGCKVTKFKSHRLQTNIDECIHPEEISCYGVCKNMQGGFYCQCSDGTNGDPYKKGGCVTTKSSFSGLSIGLIVSGGSILLLLALAAPFITHKIKLLRVNKLKERCFKQNHGLLLQQLISQNTDFGERMIIPLFDLEKATNNFNRTHEAGGGGHGIVYKGLLDLQVVAIKKSKIVVQREIDDFINEVAILSQINHRNVVKLVGCCLETEVPLLVYEFISNGTLDHHLHVEGPMSLSWDDRIRIALEVARAVSYLHSAASMPIYHRDIKSSNILLDDNFTAKVSDFGASRYIPTDQTGVTTAVQGTIGYLDPMYYYTGRLTDKSDVFSFGVLLVELLTRKKPFVRCGGDGVGLVSHFVSLLTKGNLNEIIDPQVMEEENGEVQEVAKLAATCTKLTGEDRPTMREVEMKLEILRVNKRHLAPDISPRRYNRDQIGAQYLSTEGVTKEASRQYTMEEEILLSARYPR